MSKATKIPASEWEIMEVLWGQSPLSAAEILERMGAATSWSVKTVRAFLGRLQRKKVVSRRKIHGTYVFDPAVRRGDCLRLESQSFIDRFFQGNSVSLIAHLLEEDRLDTADVQRLRGLLEQRKGRDAGVPRSTGVPPVSRMGVSPMQPQSADKTSISQPDADETATPRVGHGQDARATRRTS